MDHQPIPLRTGRAPRPALHRVGAAGRGIGGVPALPRHVVARPRLASRLAEAVACPLTLVRAPAGSGKTVATAGWAAADAPEPVVWVTVGAADLTGAGMWGLVVEELHHHGLLVAGPLPRQGAPTYDRLFLFSVAAQLSRRSRPVTLVVDCECPLPAAAAAGLHYLVQHASGGVRLVLLSRDEPPLPLWRYRMHGTLAEVGPAELAFTEEEATALLAWHGVALSEAATAELLCRTGGWAVGVTLAARALASAADPDLAVSDVRGDAGPLSAYLQAELLDTHPGAVRDVLLRTAVADLLRPGLVETLGGRRSPRTVSSLATGNALLEPVAGTPGCYRYVPVFHELLRARLLAESPERAAHLERTAAAWLAANGHLDQAVADAAAGEHWEDAARFVVEGLAVQELLGHPEHSLLRACVASLPGDVPGAPAALVRAALAVAAGDLPGADLQLERAESLVDADAAPPAHLALELVRLERATRAGEVKAALAAAEAAEQALMVQRGSLVAARPEIAALTARGRGMALATLGDMEAAARALGAGAASSVSPRCTALAADCLGHSALLAAWCGELTRATELAEGAVAGAVPDPSTAATSAEVALAWVAAERYDVTADRHLGEHRPGLPEAPLARGMLALACSRALLARGEPGEALATLSDPRLTDLPGWLRERLRVETAALLVAAGNLARASSVLDGLDTPETPEADLVRLRLSLARNELRAASTEPMVDHTDLGTRVAGLLVQAAVMLRRGESRRAAGAVDEALRLAGPERMRRPFEEAPPEVRRLLRARSGLVTSYPWLGDQSAPTRSPGRVPESPVLVEPLTDREQEVLELLAELLTTEEIAGTLFVSVNTVRTHVRSILRKLGATRRNEAIRRARSLGVLPGRATDVGITRYG